MITITGYIAKVEDTGERVKFSIADSLGKQGDPKRKTTWFNCSSTRNNYNQLKNLAKGEKVAVDGFLEAVPFKDKVYCNVIAFEVRGADVRPTQEDTSETFGEPNDLPF